MDVVLEYALRYLAAGWSIAPVRRDGRDPKDWKFPERWQRYQRTKPTETEVRQWVAGNYMQNIAVITGKLSGLVVVDIDPHKGGTTEGLPPTGCIAQTGGGGFHFVYKYPQVDHRIQSWAASEKETNPLKKGRDVRADGGLIIAPPSKHESGNTYEWIEFNPDKLGTPPAWAIEPREKVASSKKNGTNGVNKAWVSQLLHNGTSMGSRNNDTTKLAGYLASMRLPKDIVHAIVDVWMRDQETPLHDTEVNTVVDSVFRTEENNAKFHVLTLSDFMVKHGASEVSWMVRDWMPAATIGFLVSPPAGYKTWLTYDLAASVASGRPFLGKFPVDQSGPVLLIQQEDFAGDIASRNGVVIMNRIGTEPADFDDDVEKFDIAIPPTNKQVPLYFHTERQIRFENRNVMRKLHDFIVEHGIKLCILDPLYSAAETDDYMAKAIRQALQLKDTRDQTGCSFMLVHHTRKSAEDWDRQNTWGSQFVNAFSETNWHVRRVLNQAKVVLKRHFKSAGVQPFVELTFDINTQRSHYAVSSREVDEEEANAASSSDLTKDVLDSLQEACTITELATTLNKPKGKITEVLIKLKRRGDVEQGADNKYRRTDR